MKLGMILKGIMCCLLKICVFFNGQVTFSGGVTYESARIDVGRDTLDRWQGIVDILAEVIGVPSALVMRLVDSDIEVFVLSKSSGNPYIPVDREHFLGYGLYCETIIRSNDNLLIPNALKIKK